MGGDEATVLDNFRRQVSEPARTKAEQKQGEEREKCKAESQKKTSAHFCFEVKMYSSPQASGEAWQNVRKCFPNCCLQ